MYTTLRSAAAVSAVILSTTAFAADLSGSAMAGDPTWPSWSTVVAPAMYIHQSPARDPNLVPEPGAAAIEETTEGLALWQQPITDDPLQGNLDRASVPSALHAAGEQPCPCRG